MTGETDARFVIVNADDFGLSAGINRGIIGAHERGIVTSASLMVRWPDAEEAAALARSHPSLSVGLHLDMGEWIYRDGDWQPLYQVLPPDAGQRHFLDEARRQLDAFQTLLGRAPSHLDSHQHCHRDEPLRSIAIEMSRELRIPLREIASPAAYLGDFYGQCGKGESFPELVSAASLRGILAGLPPGITELGCHPAAALDFDSPYRQERLAEFAALCDPRLMETVSSEKLRLISFHEIRPPDPGDSPSASAEDSQQ